MSSTYQRVESDDSVAPMPQPLAVFVYIPNLIGCVTSMFFKIFYWTIQKGEVICLWERSGSCVIALKTI
jgi:hypothetical protein